MIIIEHDNNWSSFEVFYNDTELILYIKNLEVKTVKIHGDKMGNIYTALMKLFPRITEETASMARAGDFLESIFQYMVDKAINNKLKKTVFKYDVGGTIYIKTIGE